MEPEKKMESAISTLHDAIGAFKNGFQSQRSLADKMMGVKQLLENAIADINDANGLIDDIIEKFSLHNGGKRKTQRRKSTRGKRQAERRRRSRHRRHSKRQ